MNNKLFIFCGIPFSGKTTLAKRIATQTDFVRIDLDEIKFDLYGKGIKDSDLEQKDWDSIYQEMYQRINDALKEGKTVLHDTGNFTKHERELVKKIADRLNIEAITIFVNTSKETAKERLLHNRKTNQRFDVNDEEFDNAVNEMEPPDTSEKHVVCDPGASVEKLIQLIIQATK